VIIVLLLGLALLLPGPGSLPQAHDKTTAMPDTAWSAKYTDLDLLPWDLLNKTVYDPRTPMEWPKGLDLFDGKKVRMEGFLMPRYNWQDEGDLFLLGLNPTSFFCGPSDMTMVVDLHIADFEYDEWPLLPVEVVGTFHLSKRPGNYHPIYILVGNAWRPRSRWAQEFPGTILTSEPGLDDHSSR